MPSQTVTHRQRSLVATIVAVIALAACGGGDELITEATTPATTDVTANDQPTPNPDGQTPFAAVIECLRAEGLDVDEPAIGAPGGAGDPANRGSLPPDFSMPEGGFPDGSLPPDFSVPEGGFPGGTPPEGSFPRGSMPDGGPSGAGGLPGGDDPAFLAGVLGLDSNDPDVAAALENCSAELGN